MYSSRESSDGVRRSPARWIVSMRSGRDSLQHGCTTEWRKSREPASREWIQNEFWAVEIDPILRVGVERAHRFRCEAVDACFKGVPGTARLAPSGCDLEISEIGEIGVVGVVGVDVERTVQR